MGIAGSIYAELFRWLTWDYPRTKTKVYSIGVPISPQFLTHFCLLELQWFTQQIIHPLLFHNLLYPINPFPEQEPNCHLVSISCVFFQLLWIVQFTFFTARMTYNAILIQMSHGHMFFGSCFSVLWYIKIPSKLYVTFYTFV